MNSAYQQLQIRFKQLSQLDHALVFLNWDQMVMMPAGGVGARSGSVAELAGMHHSLLTAVGMGDWLDEAEEQAAAQADSAQNASLREMRRVWRQASCLPADLVKKKIVAGSRCEHAWRSQRAENDWAGFLSNFREVVTLSREEAQLRLEAANRGNSSPAKERLATRYDSLLELHCAGDTTELIDQVFTRLKGELPDLLQAVVEKQAGRQSAKISETSAQQYPIAQQRQLSQELMRVLGFDFAAGRLDESAHPFSTGVKGDLRITTRYRDDDFLDALFSTAHETGHASYEGGLPDQWQGLPVGLGRNMCIHESQSLLFEKQILLSKAFIRYFEGSIHNHLPSTQSMKADELWEMATTVKPGYIRVEADEVSYPLHVLLRYEIEKMLINGDIEADEIPQLWDERMRQYLGLSTEGNYQNGCLQDIHWTDGAFGYFPSYTLGAINSAQLFSTIKSQHQDWQERFAEGDCSFVIEWLADNIWSRGCELESQPLMVMATGEGTNPDHFLQHLKARYISEAY